MISQFAGVLLSEGPDPHGLPELMQFGRFVGSWDLDVFFYNEEGDVSRQVAGEWHFGWVLEGRAVADVWIVPPRLQREKGAPPAGEYGMSLRFYDPERGAWQSTWLGPVNKVVFPFFANQVGDEMILERSDGETLVRWKFSDITPDSFTWRNMRSADRGVTWRLEQRFLARRAIPDTSPLS